MKYYETHYEEYIQSVKSYNIHPEMEELFRQFPSSIPELGNMILYGPCGSGKYSQMLYLLERYSPSHLKYDKKIRIQTEKQAYTYRISDIHYEIDMGLLGCHSKTLWHEVFFQIVDILSVKPDKTGFIVCKNFHAIHSELLDVFYSYIQHSNTLSPNIHIRFVLLTEHISFIPNNILNCCNKISISKPSVEMISNILFVNASKNMPCFPEMNTIENVSEVFLQKISSSRKKLSPKQLKNIQQLLKKTDNNTILNIKEIQSFSVIENTDQLPKDVFNIICDNIIQTMMNPNTLEFTEFRESLYDILIYNLDITECVWYIFSHFVRSGNIQTENTIKSNTIKDRNIKGKNITEILSNIYVFLKYYNNNYRPIYHLESIFFYLLLQIHPQFSQCLPI
jgi:hypothetical protein